MPEANIGPAPPRLASKRRAALSSLLVLSAVAAGACDPWQPTIEVTPAYNQIPTAPPPPPLYVQSLPPAPQVPYGQPYPVPVPPGGVPYPVPVSPGGVPYPVPVPPGGVPYPVPVSPGGVPYPVPPGQPLPIPTVASPGFDPSLSVGQCHQIQAWGPFVLPRVFKGALPSDLAPIGGTVQSGVYILVEVRAYGPDAGRIQAPPLRSAKRVTGDVMEEWFEVQGGAPSVYTDRFVSIKKDWNWSTQCPLQQSGARGTHRYSAQGDLLVFYKVDPAIPNLEQVFFYRRAF